MRCDGAGMSHIAKKIAPPTMAKRATTRNMVKNREPERRSLEACRCRRVLARECPSRPGRRPLKRATGV